MGNDVVVNDFQENDDIDENNSYVINTNADEENGQEDQSEDLLNSHRRSRSHSKIN